MRKRQIVYLPDKSLIFSSHAAARGVRSCHPVRWHPEGTCQHCRAHRRPSNVVLEGGRKTFARSAFYHRCPLSLNFHQVVPKRP